MPERPSEIEENVERAKINCYDCAALRAFYDRGNFAPRHIWDVLENKIRVMDLMGDQVDQRAIMRQVLDEFPILFEERRFYTVAVVLYLGFLQQGVVLDPNYVKRAKESTESVVEDRGEEFVVPGGTGIAAGQYLGALELMDKDFDEFMAVVYDCLVEIEVIAPEAAERIKRSMN